MNFKTDQESFWAGKFGSEYINRNQGEVLLARNLDFFSKALRATRGLKTCLEFGANIGMNLKALKLLYPEQNQYGIEINEDAVKELEKVIPKSNVYYKSILDFDNVKMTWDLVLIKGVLIHINPMELERVYEKLVSSCGKYLLLAEYYNPEPVEIKYRGHSGKLFKRDFAGEIIDRNKNMCLVDYGFSYKRDPSFPQDDINWFLMEKRG